MTNLLVVKITTLVSLLIASIIASFLPFVMAKISSCYERYKRRRDGNEDDSSNKTIKKNNNSSSVMFYFRIFLDLSQGFAGGVLLAGGLLHLIPESNEMIVDILQSWAHPNVNETMLIAPTTMAATTVMTSFKRSLRAGDEPEEAYPWWVNFPWALTCSALSLLLLYSIETFANIIIGTAHDHHNHGHGHGNHASNKKQTTSKVVKQSNDNNDNSSLQQRNKSNNSNYYQQQIDEDDTNDSNRISHDYHYNHTGHHHNHDHDHDHHEHTQHHHHSVNIPKIISAVVLWFSLGAHSVFAGMGLGSEDDERRMWSLFIAIVSHHLVESFALGVIMENACRRRFIFGFFLLLAYCAATPGGIGIGLAVESLESSSTVFKLVQALILAVASGAFLHVSLLEILVNHKHFDDDDDEEEGEHNHHHSSDEEAEPLGYENNEEEEKSKLRKQRCCDNFVTTLRIGLYFTGFVVMAVLAAFE